ncbi:MAG TPA: TIGR01777 family oxidoreductase [Candidatus Eisenbacteria bacterium]|nr:TIGR01777 family oxidoreductase [Candidatus Eisenbacteria bacterium]
MKIAGAGTSGLIGSSLTARLVSRHTFVRLRRPVSPEWDAAIDGADAVINLAGENIAGRRWTPAQKMELIQSRLKTTRAVVDAIERARVKPRILLNASATGFYGPRGDEPLGEESPKGAGFLADLCAEWERQARRAESMGVRTVLLRTGVVLAKEGGALAKMLPAFRLGLGGPLGSGRQYFSWIHLDDEVAAIEFALENDSVRGPVNLTAPNPVTNEEFTRALARALGRPAAFRAPAKALQILLGEMSELLLTGQNVRPGALQRQGFRFRYETVQPALVDLISR